MTYSTTLKIMHDISFTYYKLFNTYEKNASNTLNNVETAKSMIYRFLTCLRTSCEKECLRMQYHVYSI